MNEHLNQLADLFVKTRAAGGSDCIISCGLPVKAKVKGGFRVIRDQPLTDEELRGILCSLLTDSEARELEVNRCIDLSRRVGAGGRVRFNIFFQRMVPVIIGRLLSSKIPKIEELGIPMTFRNMLGRRPGLILVTGPTGSGKTTTLASAIQYLNEEKEYHIISMEDPIEYEHENIRCVVEQIEIGRDAKSFSQALRSSLRQSPDVIVVGEMRDLESIQNALTLAETGHLVLATLHTRDAVSAVSRIVDIFPESQAAQIHFILSQVLIGVLSQRLMPMVNGKEMVLACEVLLNTPAVQRLIRDRKAEQIASVIQSSGGEGMIALNDSLAYLVSCGLIGGEEALSQSTRPDSLLKQLERLNQKTVRRR
jgi:twitching motility protein PilT